MEEGVLPLTNILSNQSDSFMDFDYMDELLIDGCWLEAANASEFPHFDPISPFDPSFSFPALDFSNGESSSNASPPKIVQEERKRAAKISDPIIPSSTSVAYSSIESSEQSKRWWIGPRDSRPVMERLVQAVGFMKSFSGNKDVLIQVWVPVTKGGKRVLTTNHQPFSLDLNCPNLAHYREISVNYLFPADDDSEGSRGLPGRVYRNKAPEWTPDVRFFSWEEYPRVGHAQEFDVRGTLAVPILEQGSRDCLGVIEVIMTKQKIQYRPELESVCKALEAVDLRSPDLSNTQKVKTGDSSPYQAALPEILEVLKSACDTHRLPLAQTWVPCVLQGNGGCWNSEQNTKEDCAAPVESACYVGDPRVKGFNEACYECHLLKGQGIVGTAFQTNEPRFSSDVSACSKAEYPLSHHARMFGLRAAVAIRLRSTCTGKADFVLEFFLPTNCDSPEEHKRMLTSLSAIIQNTCRTLRVVTDKEMREEGGNEELVETTQVGSGQLDSDSKEGVTFAATANANASTSYDGSSLHTKGEKKRTKAEKIITLEVLRQHFAGSLKDAARNLGVCPTTLKRICRQNGIQRWPSRKIKKVGHSLQKIQRVIDSVQGASAGLQIGSFYSNFPELASPNASRTTHFSNPDNLKPSEESTVLVLSPTSSCSHSHSSSSSQCCSSGAQQNSNPSNAQGGKDYAIVKEEPALKRSRSDANLPSWSDGAKPFSWPGKQASAPPRDREGPAGAERDGPRIKVTFGEDTIRFRMKSEWRYKDLMHEISRRFGVENNEGGYHLKYLDDDSEWVLLTCDADLEECIDVCNSTIRLSFLHDSHSQSQIRSFTVRGASL